MTEREKLKALVQMEINRSNLLSTEYIFSLENFAEDCKMFIDDIISTFSITIAQKDYKVIEEEVEKQIGKLDDKRNSSFIVDGIYEMLSGNK